jgi:hypothetical protein
MAAVNANMFGASIPDEDARSRGSAVMVLPLNLIAMIVSHVCSRLHYYPSLAIPIS